MSEHERRRWHTADGAEARGLRRPDGRWLIWLPSRQQHAWQALANLAAQDTSADLLTNIAGDRPADVTDALMAAGFLPHRVEHLWRVPVSSLRGLPVSTDHDLLPVDRLDLAAVAALDNTIRGDIPGAEEWQGTAADLRDSLDDVEFDPALYLIAKHTQTGSLDGLIRVWNRNPLPRLGCIGVRRAWRRTGLAATLIQSVASVLHRRGVAAITAEKDEGNRPSATMARRAGGEVTGTRVEWLRAPQGYGGDEC